MNQWLCRVCHRLLGIEDLGKLEIKHKKATFVIVGYVETRCTRCDTLNVVTVGDGIFQPDALTKSGTLMDILNDE